MASVVERGPNSLPPDVSGVIVSNVQDDVKERLKHVHMNDREAFWYPQCGGGVLLGCSH